MAATSVHVSPSTKVEGQSLTSRLVADVLAASLAGFAVSPMVSAVDKALAENASGKEKLWTSFGKSLKELVLHPIKYVKAPSFRWIWLVYGSTYLAANTVDSICEVQKKNAAFPKWVATSATNTAACIAKDRAFARLFGTTVPQNVPIGSYGAWLTRDLLSMAFFFTLPPIVGKEISKRTGDEKMGYYSAQFALPLLLQFVTTPIHLLGYNIYNDPKGTVSDRITFMKKDYTKNVGIRMLRMIAPWSVGVIGNKELRLYLAKSLKNTI